MKRALLLLILLALALTSCAKPERSATVFAMDTVMDLTVYGDEDLIDQARDTITDMESRLSVTLEGSEINTLNAAGEGRLSDDTAALLSAALDICALTGGALDVTVYPLVRAWGFTTGNYRIPGREEVSRLLEKVDWSAVTLEDGEARLPDGAMVDLGAVAKGYLSDAIVKLWRDGGAESGLLNLGGNVYALGTKPDGSAWRVGVRDPSGAGYLGVIEARDTAVVTSGGYERYFEQNGRKYWHILDPKTGAPADSGLASVTVVGKEGLLCDGLSTALFVMGLDGASELWRSRTDFELVLVTSGGEVYITEGLEDSFTLAGSYKDMELQVIRRG